MLLVLFQTAISNLVLFRHHTAVSRALASLFKSFQSSAKVLDPDANPSLFQSTLAIVIRVSPLFVTLILSESIQDVPDNDADGIVQEFKEKLSSIVDDEQGGNFITRLHRGNTVIIPWPVISSPAFYSQFEDINDILLDQPVIYPTGGKFLRVLKMLMAKVQACDWSALDKNLGMQRANSLHSQLLSALVAGRMADGSPLTVKILSLPRYIADRLCEKVLDADEAIVSPDTGIQLRVPRLVPEGEEVESSIDVFHDLYKQLVGTTSRGTKQSELKFRSIWQDQINAVVEQRIKLVAMWIDINTRNLHDNSDIQSLGKVFDAHARLLRSRVELCSAQCTSCGRNCLKFQNHDAYHECFTDHACPFNCEFVSDHNGAPAEHTPRCTAPAFHSGSHMHADDPSLPTTVFTCLDI
ncbi:hypothetical protein FRB91_009284 [Serendipita sp. 411]|nr:hypothetical protein FRB91_009284 [Serendipita sp. 411]